MSVCMGVGILMSSGQLRPEEEMGSLELKVHAVESWMVRVLGTELWSSANTGCTLSH